MFKALFAIASVGAVVGWVGCSTQSDLNTQCHLVKKDAGDPTGRTVAYLMENEIPPTHTDFISFGSPDCDERICVRDADFPRGDAGDVAYGYCSTPCAQGVSGQCSSQDGALDQNPVTALSCRALLLDTQTLNAICQNDAGACQEFFANTRTPFFCARGGTPDGG